MCKRCEFPVQITLRCVALPCPLGPHGSTITKETVRLRFLNRYPGIFYLEGRLEVSGTQMKEVT